MPENPYAPPTSQVADIEGDTTSLARPRLVVVGIGLLAFDLALGVPGLSWRGADATLLFNVVVIALMGLITWFAWEGRNWARIVHLVVLLLALLATALAIVVLRATPQLSAVSGEVFFNGWNVAQNLLNVAGVVLLFTPPANAWYRAMRAARMGSSA